MAYQGRQPGVGVRNRFIYSATGGQTSFSGADSNGLTLAYSDATYVDVFLNGTLLVPVTDYAATTKTSVVLGSGAAASDIVEIVAYDISSMSDAVSKTGDTMTGNLSFGDNNKAIFGAGSDLQIYHNGGDSLIADTGAGDLYIRGSNNIFLQKGDGSGTFIATADDGAVTLYHNNASKLATTATGIDVTGTAVMDGLTIDTTDPFMSFKESGATKLFIGESSVVGGGGAGYYDFYAVTGLGQRFFTNSVERMRIDSSGNVGIGTSPATSLHVKATTNATLTLEGDAGAGSSFINFAANGGTTKAQISGAKYGSNGGQIVMSTNNSSGTLTEAMRIDASGNLLVGTTTGGSRLDVYNPSNWAASFGRPAGTHGVVRFTIAGTQCGSITANGSSTSYVTSSDYRLKENVVDLTGASARVNQLDVKRFNFIADDTNTLVDGFLAHEVATVVPEAITGTKDAMRDEEYEVTPAVLDDDGNVTTEAIMGTRNVPDYQGIDQSKLVPLLTAALQEALAEIASLKTRVQALEDV